MEKVKKFLEIGSGYGSGYGSGDGSGYGSGDGYGYGSGYGSGDGIKSFDGKCVYLIDDVQTIIASVFGNTALGYILRDDLTLERCYVAKGRNMFAHGETLEEAVEALQEKIFETLDTDDKIDAFIEEADLEKKYPAKYFYDWHHKLTGSCEMGRKDFASRNGIDLEKDSYTVEEFIRITENAYGGDVIKQLKERIK